VVDCSEALAIDLSTSVLRIAAAAPVAVRQTKATLRRAGSLEDAPDGEALCQAIDDATDAMAEAVAAFRDKRKPVSRGQ
jgi:hypothetical protein